MVSLVFLLFVPAVVAQPSVDQPWSDLRSKNVPGVEFSLRLLEQHQYRRGELIRMEVKSPAQSFVPGQPPPHERWQFGGFLLDPPVGCGSLQKPCMMSAAFQFDKSDPMLGFGERSEPLTFALNTYLPALPPGHYRVAALARKLVLTSRGPLYVGYGYADPPQYLVSDAVEFEVAPAAAAWISRTIASSVATLKGPQPRSREAYEARRAAAEQLRFLDDPTTWRASLDLLPTEENILLRGLSATSEPARVCELMDTRLPAPEQSVSSSYLSVMAQTCERAHLPPPQPAPVAGQLDREREAYLEKRRTYHSGLMKKAAATLAASLSLKQQEPKAAALATLIQYCQQSRDSEPPQPAPEWIPTLTREFVHSFAGLEASRQRYLLELYAMTIDSPELAPLLESVLDRWKPGDYYEAPHAALRALYKTDPARARARILAELPKPRTWLDAPLLALLPASAVPPMDDALIEALASAQRAGGWNPQLRMAALAKYATPRALSHIRAIYESQQEPCQPEIMAYFVRVDPAYADRVFRSHAWDMQAEPPPCTVPYFQRTPPLAMHAGLEKYMIAYLMHRDVFVKTTAARSLGLYGSNAALPPLWDAFRYFHKYWQGKGAELARNGEGVSLEVELRNAIARGRQWLATETDLRMIESLCISERCLYETQQDLRARQRPLRIEVLDQPDGLRGMVAQYYGIETVTALKAKLAQFERGTKFLLVARGPNTKRAAAEICDFALSRGLIVLPTPP